MLAWWRCTITIPTPMTTWPLPLTSTRSTSTRTPECVCVVLLIFLCQRIVTLQLDSSPSCVRHVIPSTCAHDVCGSPSPSTSPFFSTFYLTHLLSHSFHFFPHLKVVRNLPPHRFVYHDSNGPNRRTQSFLLSEICTVILWQDCYGKDYVRKSYWSTVGTRFPIWNAYSNREIFIFLFCEFGWHQIGWKGTKHWSDVERTQQRSWFGRINIFSWSCVLGMYSTTLWNKQRYCWQLQNHVWIQNFSMSNWKITILGKSVFFFVVLRYGRSYDIVSCQTGRRNNSTKEEEMKSAGELWKVSSQIVVKSLYLTGIGRPDIPWSMNKLARSMWIQTTLSCGKHCQTVQTGTVSRLQFWRRPWGFKIYIRWNIVHFWKSFICSNQLDV